MVQNQGEYSSGTTVPEILFGDYYPLTQQQRNPAAWTAYHLYLPANQEGMILALHRARATFVR